MNPLIPLALAGLLLTFAPAASAEETTEPACPEGYVATPEGCSRQAWVDDCPEDMMCAAGAPGEHANETSDPDRPTYSGDCGGEVCAYDEPGRFGPDDCIDCMKPIGNGTSGTCMDGAEAGEGCRDDVYYMDGPSRGPADGSCENCRGDGAEADPVSAPAGDAKDAPGLGGLVVLAALAAVLVAIRRKD
ncbi:MAG TPA: hypothetical protein VFH47_03955 [Candidatus Thermoplasmatota archaeon]|nr:hypothetical protein [Candidatus Thermoplasmatota archaeon]